MDMESSVIIGIVDIVLSLGLLYGLPLMMPRYRAEAERKRLASIQLDVPPRG